MAENVGHQFAVHKPLRKLVLRRCTKGLQMSQEFFDSTPAEKTKWRENSESEIGSNEIFSSRLTHSNTHRNFELLLTLRACTSLYLTRPPHLTRNVAKFHLLHPSPGSSTGPMCLKLPRCRARSQPAHDSCGSWVISMNSVVKKQH